ncbi:MAG: DUF1648 domain-containing protein [Clostridia bacterium]|nr:DUF1648 domain-containing protein [Clostridia bacterium]
MKENKPVILVLIISLAAAAIAYPFLPQQIPVQWTIEGAVRTCDKIFIFAFALIPAIIYYSIKSKRSK